MKEILNIENKSIKICYNKTDEKILPVVILNNYSNDGEKIFDKCNEIGCKDFILVCISNLNWDDDMSPWYAPKINKNDTDFLGKADEYLKILLEKIIPKVKEFVEINLEKQIEYYVIAGYSLAGLFAVYSAYKTDLFNKILSCSGSFWFPNFIEFVQKNRISNNIKQIYFSLGNRESKARNKVLQTVEENTKKTEKFLREQGIKTIYEENEGNHFQSADLRIAKGIKWILK